MSAGRPFRPAFLTIALAFATCTERAPGRADTVTRVVPAAETAQDTGAASRAVTSAALALDGGGLRIVLEPSGSARPIPFGEPRASVVEPVSRRRNGRQPEMAENLECRATVATWPACGMQRWFTPDAAPQFIGWSPGSCLTIPCLADTIRGLRLPVAGRTRVMRVCSAVGPLLCPSRLAGIH